MDEPALHPEQQVGNSRRSVVKEANLLLTGHPPDSAEFDRGLELLTGAAQQQDADAQWHLGALYFQVSMLPDADAKAFHWLTRASDQGVAPAMDRLADLYMTGRGTAQDDTKALALQERLAATGYAPAWCTLGYMHTQGMGTAIDLNQAADCFLHGAALGDPPAYFGLGVRFALGAGAPEDRAFGCALLRRAADAGYPNAGETLAKVPLDAAKRQSAHDWHGRLKQNYDAIKPTLERLYGAAEAGAPLAELERLAAAIETHFSAIGHPALGQGARGRLELTGERGSNDQLVARPHDAKARSERPRVFTYEQFATLEECAHLIAKATPNLNRPDAYKGGSEAYADLVLFSGEGTPIRPLEADAVVRLMERRICRITGRPPEAFEPCSVIRYLPGQEYRPHADFFTDEQLANNRERHADQGGQRVATFLLYLQRPEGGGETEYPHAHEVISGSRGLGLLHYNVTPDGAPDELSQHIGRPVTRGEKWLWRCALRERSLR